MRPDARGVAAARGRSRWSNPHIHPGAGKPNHADSHSLVAGRPRREARLGEHIGVWVRRLHPAVDPGEPPARAKRYAGRPTRSVTTGRVGGRGGGRHRPGRRIPGSGRHRPEGPAGPALRHRAGALGRGPARGQPRRRNGAHARGPAYCVHPVEYTGVGERFGEYYDHPGDEFVYVVAGEIEIDLQTADGPRLHVLGPGDSIYYPRRAPHRWRAVSDGSRVRLLTVQNATGEVGRPPDADMTGPVAGVRPPGIRRYPAAPHVPSAGSAGPCLRGTTGGARGLDAGRYGGAAAGGTAVPPGPRHCSPGYPDSRSPDS